MKLAICLSGGISEAVPFVCRVTAVPAAGNLEKNVPAMPGSERIMNSKSTGKFEWKCVSEVLVLEIRPDGN
ncbi:hypothetical protein [uncultured Akkermansia sp.]|uniref:hypothetical protein n=1 Tax=uncultured Akkermansia sp. TaxID=512294 RepID=UPI002633F093|nr:hypothetical protein [uncultured Akkermansia sp.]